MLKLGNIFRGRRKVQTDAFTFSRPLVLLQSDDWGRVGLRDQEGLAALRASGIEIGENPYDFYTLETAADIRALRDMLHRHHDSTGRSPSLVANFIMANLDFAKIAAANFRQIYLLPLTEGFPGEWSRPGLLEAYREAVAEGFMYPALHGLTHFCWRAAEEALAEGGDRAVLLRSLWQAGTPYIFWRMPWVGYEYCKPENPGKGFLSAELQTTLIHEAADIFRTFFSRSPLSACAPGYRANQDTRFALVKCGVQVLQNGPGNASGPFMDEQGLLTLSRSLDFEPAQGDPSLEECMRIAKDRFTRGAPLIISMHSINFHSGVKNFLDPSLKALDRFLSALEAQYPDLLYVHDGDLYNLVVHGSFETEHGAVAVNVQRESGGGGS